MGLPILGAIKGLLTGGGPLVGDLLKLDKEAQRDVAEGIRYGLIILSSALSLLVVALVILIGTWIW